LHLSPDHPSTKRMKVQQNVREFRHFA
jgi:hypothetical protein